MLMRTTEDARDRTAHAALYDQLIVQLPPAVRIRSHGWRPWASASFAGARHWFELVPEEGNLAALPGDDWTERAWPLTGAFVADVAIMPGGPADSGRRIEMLLVDD